MPHTLHAYTPPRNRLLRWLTDAGVDVPLQIRNILIGEMFSAPRAVLTGMANGLMVDAVGLGMHQGLVFLVFMMLELLIVSIRMSIVRAAARAAASGQVTPTGAYLIVAMLWCGLQGSMAFTCMRSGDHTLQLLSGISVLALVGPICSRNYAAPRFALLLVSLLIIPLVAGAIPFSDRWMLVMVVQLPMLMYASTQIITRLQKLSVEVLTAQYESQHRARHDSLTGLLNRAGLAEALASHDMASQPFILFYLDLDGFKPVNDTFGHQAGDALLCAVADRLRACVRADDLVARLGGDEFAIIAHRMLPSAAAPFAEGVISRIGSPPYFLDRTRPVRIGVSVGSACAPRDGPTLHELHRNADAALYGAKGAGRGVYRRFADLAGLTAFDHATPKEAAA